MMHLRCIMFLSMQRGATHQRCDMEHNMIKTRQDQEHITIKIRIDGNALYHPVPDGTIRYHPNGMVFYVSMSPRGTGGMKTR